jgi:hypothetical protein
MFNKLGPKACFVALMISNGMESAPGDFPVGRFLMTVVSSSMVKSVSRRGSVRFSSCDCFKRCADLACSWLSRFVAFAVCVSCECDIRVRLSCQTAALAVVVSRV